MKHLLAVLLCLLLSGCAPQTSPDTEVPSETVPEKTSMYDPLHPIELAYPGEVRAYPLTYEDVHGILACGNDVLTLSGEEHTTLTLLTGDDLLYDITILRGNGIAPPVVVVSVVRLISISNNACAECNGSHYRSAGSLLGSAVSCSGTYPQGRCLPGGPYPLRLARLPHGQRLG